MKYLLSVFIISSALAASGKPLNTVDKIQSLNSDNKEVSVTLWGNSRVFRISKDHSLVPCLENAFKSKQKVALDLDNEAGLILDCKMAGTGLPGANSKAQK